MLPELDHETSEPPQPPAAPSSRAEATGRHAALPPEPEARFVRRMVRRVKRLEEIVGDPPNPLTDHPGTGMQAVQWKILTKLEAIGTDVAAIRLTKATEDEAAARRSEWKVWAIRVAGAFLIVSALGGLIALMSHLRFV